jgi:hypothetical protein
MSGISHMVLDIGIKSKSSNKYEIDRSFIVSLEDSEFSLLLDAFDEIMAKCGVEIDQYDDAVLQGGQLILLRDLISNVIEEVKLKPKEWDEYIGFQLKPKKKLYRKMNKKAVLAKLNKFIKLIETANIENRSLIFIGD